MNQAEKDGDKNMYLETAKVEVKNQKNEVVASREYQKRVFGGLSSNEKTGKPEGGETAELLGAAIQFLSEQAIADKKTGPDADGVLILLKHATYGYDLGVKNGIRTDLNKGLEGPDKSILKSAKDLMTARASIGKPITLEDALARVRKSMED